MPLPIIGLGKKTPAFLETGTFKGNGVTQAKRVGYDDIHSIEIHEQTYNQALELFKSDIESGLVTLHLGDSGDLVGEIARTIAEPITFWLDAHDQTMNDAGRGELVCPLIKELAGAMRARSESMRANDIILIDDMRNVEHSKAYDINTGELYDMLWQYNKNFVIYRRDGHVPGDVLICEPNGRLTL